MSKEDDKAFPLDLRVCDGPPIILNPDGTYEGNADEVEAWLRDRSYWHGLTGAPQLATAWMLYRLIKAEQV